MKPKIKHPRIDSKKNPELKLLASLIGEFIEYWGFKAVQGRMWTYLYLLDQPLSSIQLAQLLDISPALVTQSVQTLLQYRVILEAEKGVNGVLRFIANPDVSDAIAGVLQGRESVLLEKIKLAQHGLERKKRTQAKAVAKAGTKPDPLLETDRGRVKQVGQWIDLAQLLLGSGLNLLQSSHTPFEHPEDLAKAIPQIL